MNDTSEAEADLDFIDSDFDMNISPFVIVKEWTKIKRGFFLLAAVTVLMLTAATWKLMKPDMSTYDGTAVLIMFLIIGFFIVLIMFAVVLLRLRQILERTTELEQQIAEIEMNTLPKLDSPDDDMFSGA